MQYGTYRNNEALERDKPYWIEDVSDRRVFLGYLESGGNVRRCFEASLAYADAQFGAPPGTVLDLGAGVCWTTALLSRRPPVEEVHALDDSQHRLFKSYRWFLSGSAWPNRTFNGIADGLPDASERYPDVAKQYVACMRDAGFECVRQRLDYPVFKDSRVLAVSYFDMKAR